MEYFDLVGTQVLMGRGLSERDAPGAPALAVVNQEFAKKVLPGQNPIGVILDRHRNRPKIITCPSYEDSNS